MKLSVHSEMHQSHDPTGQQSYFGIIPWNTL
jgi:hypothetical protein